MFKMMKFALRTGSVPGDGSWNNPIIPPSVRYVPLGFAFYLRNFHTSKRSALRKTNSPFRRLTKTRTSLHPTLLTQSPFFDEDQPGFELGFKRPSLSLICGKVGKLSLS